MPDFIQDKKYQSFVKPYIRGPIDEFANVQKELRDTYDENILQYDALQEANDNMKAIPWKADDVTAKNQIFEHTKKYIDEAAKEGNYENRSRLVRKALREFKERYTPILSNYQADIKKREDLMKFDKIADPLERERAHRVLSKMYNNVPQDQIEYDSNGRVKVKPYQDFNAAADVNIIEKADKLGNDWKADKNTTVPYKVVNKDGTVTWQQKTIESADEQEIYNYLHSTLAKDPETLGFLKQKKILYGDKFDENKAIEEAANFSAKKHGFIKSDIDYKFDPEWEASSKANAERKVNSATGIFASSSTDFKVDLDNLKTNKDNLIVQQQDLQTRLNKSNDSIIKSELQQQLNNINHKVRLQTEFQGAMENKMNWNWGSKYAEYAKQARDKGVSIISPFEFKKLSSTSPYDDFTNTVIAGTYGIKNGLLLSNIRSKYKDAIEEGNKNNSFKQEHELVVGNDNTYSGQYTNNLNEAAKNGSLELLNQDGSQFDMDKQFEGIDFKTIKMIPTKGLIGGKPGFAITGSNIDKEGRSTGKKTYYVTMDDNTSNREDYQQNGMDLLKQAGDSKYASSPDKRKQLAETGLMQIGYSNVGNEISNLNLPVVKGGTAKNPVELSLSNGMKIQVIEGQGITYYRVALPVKGGRTKLLENPLTHKTEFGSEEDLMKVWGIYNIQNSNPELLNSIK